MLIKIVRHLWGVMKRVSHRVRTNRSIAAQIAAVNAAVIVGVLLLEWSFTVILQVYWLVLGIELAFGLVAYARRNPSRPRWYRAGSTLYATGVIGVFWVSNGALILMIVYLTSGKVPSGFVGGIGPAAVISLGCFALVNAIWAVQEGYPDSPTDPTYLGPAVAKLMYVIPLLSFIVGSGEMLDVPFSPELTALVTLALCEGHVEFHRQLDVDRFFGDTRDHFVDEML